MSIEYFISPLHLSLSYGEKDAFGNQDECTFLYDTPLPMEYIKLLNNAVSIHSVEYSGVGGLLSHIACEDDAMQCFLKDNILSIYPVIDIVDGRLCAVTEVECLKPLYPAALEAVADEIPRQFRDDWGQEMEIHPIPLPDIALAHKDGHQYVGTKKDLERKLSCKCEKPQNATGYLRFYNTGFEVIHRKQEEHIKDILAAAKPQGRKKQHEDGNRHYSAPER